MSTNTRWSLRLLAVALLGACNAVSGVDDYKFGTTTTTATTTSDGGHGTTTGAGGNGASGGSTGGTANQGGCDTGEKICPDGCFGTDDPLHGCGTGSCAPCSLPNATATCSGGACAVGTCTGTFDDCTADPGCESDLATDEQHCGDCATACGGGLTCCASNCRDAQLDPTNCGTCGKTCSDTEACQGGNCDCRPGLTQVGSDCKDFDTDPDHCGMLNKICSGATPKCQGGICVATCTAPATDCSGACVDKEKDPLNCGGCDSKCNSDQVCVDSECKPWHPAVGCTSCPCADCIGGDLCCTYPNASFEICVNAIECPGG